MRKRTAGVRDRATHVASVSTCERCVIAYDALMKPRYSLHNTEARTIRNRKKRAKCTRCAAAGGEFSGPLSLAR